MLEGVKGEESMALSLCKTVTDAQGRELLEHGTPLFPIACYHDDLQKEWVPWHWHEELEVLIVSEGTAVVAADSEKYVLQQGEGCFINRGVLHAAWNVGEEACHFHSSVFHPRLVGGSMDSVFWQKYLNPVMEDQSLKMICFRKNSDWHRSALDAIENTWQACSTEGAGYEFKVREELSKLSFLICTNHPVRQNRISEKALRDGERIKQMLQYVQEHYGEELEVSEIAASALVSTSECLRCFRSTIGVTPMQYVIRLRVEKAAELLAETDGKITEIGVQCGFQEMSYFARTFRKVKGCTPSAYRRNKRQSEG